MPQTEFSHPMDMMFGSDGNLYLLEYGQKWNSRNLDARLARIHYVPGNRTPIARITTDKIVGSAPLSVMFSGASSEDYDNDNLTYEWSLEPGQLFSKDITPSYTFNEEGKYTVQLKVKDKDGEMGEASVKILVGNDPPELSLELDTDDAFYWDSRKINYKAVVTDKQDGSTSDGTIDPKDIIVTLDYIPEGEDMILATLGHQQNKTPEGKKIIDRSACKACHSIDVKVNGPSYNDIANRYTNDDKDYLVSKIITGGSGVWGETMMLAHPQLEVAEVKKVVNFILSLNTNIEPKDNNLPLEGTIDFVEHTTEENKSEGTYVLMASYLDKGTKDLQDANLSVSKQIIFTAPILEAEEADERSPELTGWNAGGASLIGSIVNNSFLKFDSITLNGLKSIKFSAYYSPKYNYDGILEIRENSPTGKVLGKAALKYYSKEKEKIEYYTIKVDPTINKGSLYLVFKNLNDKDHVIANANWIRLNYMN